MIDTDLAVLYDTQTKALKQQVRRNIDRFPKDFMFELTVQEAAELLKASPRLEKLKHSSVRVMVFTEQGISMLSSVLKSKKAIQMNIEIMRAFAKYRALLMENKELKKEIEQLDEKLNTAFKFLLEKIDELTPHYQKGSSIGFKIKGKRKWKRKKKTKNKK